MNLYQLTFRGKKRATLCFVVLGETVDEAIARVRAAAYRPGSSGYQEMQTAELIKDEQLISGVKRVL